MYQRQICAQAVPPYDWDGLNCTMVKFKSRIYCWFLSPIQIAIVYEINGRMGKQSELPGMGREVAAERAAEHASASTILFLLMPAWLGTQ